MLAAWQALTENAAYSAGALLLAFAGAIAFWIALILPYRRSQRRSLTAEFQEEVGLLFLASLIGLSVGLMTGLSRDSAVGAVTPAVLTLLGALIAYLYSDARQIDSARRFAIMVACIALTFSFSWGVSSGSNMRAIWDRHTEQLALYKLKYAAQLELVKLRYQAELATWKAANTLTAAGASGPIAK